MKKVLIVDDDRNILLLLSKALRGQELEIATATTLEEAEYAINHASPDLILADIRLTGVLGREGLELLDFVKEKSPETEVIIMTGFGSPDIEQESYERGAAAYFEKPLDLRVLAEAIRGLGIPAGF